MDAAFPNPIDGQRLVRHPSQRSAVMPTRLSESEFEKEVDACLPQLTAIARRLCSDDETASDAVQQALLRASKAWRRFRGGSQVSTWLTRIVIREARRVMADQRRTRLKTNSLSEPNMLGAATEVAAADHEGPSRQAQQDELKRLIRDAAAQLPDRQREVFALVVWQDMTVANVAKLLEINEQAVYSNLHVAREQLKRKLDSHMGKGVRE